MAAASDYDEKSGREHSVHDLLCAASAIIRFCIERSLETELWEVAAAQIGEEMSAWFAAKKLAKEQDGEVRSPNTTH